jgi:hypothetical protein
VAIPLGDRDSHFFVVAMRLVESVRGIEVAIFAGIFAKNLVELVPPILPDGGSHFWLASFPHPESLFCFAHLLILRQNTSRSVLKCSRRRQIKGNGSRLEGDGGRGETESCRRRPEQRNLRPKPGSSFLLSFLPLSPCNGARGLTVYLEHEAAGCSLMDAFDSEMNLVGPHLQIDESIVPDADLS